MEFSRSRIVESADIFDELYEIGNDVFGIN